MVIQDSVGEKHVTQIDTNPVVVNISSDDDILAKDGDQDMKERRRSERLKDTNLHTMDKVTDGSEKEPWR